MHSIYIYIYIYYTYIHRHTLYTQCYFVDEWMMNFDVMWNGMKRTNIIYVEMKWTWGENPGSQSECSKECEEHCCWNRTHRNKNHHRAAAIKVSSEEDDDDDEKEKEEGQTTTTKIYSLVADCGWVCDGDVDDGCWNQWLLCIIIIIRNEADLPSDWLQMTDWVPPII